MHKKSLFLFALIVLTVFSGLFTPQSLAVANPIQVISVFTNDVRSGGSPVSANNTKYLFYAEVGGGNATSTTIGDLLVLDLSFIGGEFHTPQSDGVTFVKVLDSSNSYETAGVRHVVYVGNVTAPSYTKINMTTNYATYLGCAYACYWLRGVYATPVNAIAGFSTAYQNITMPCITNTTYSNELWLGSCAGVPIAQNIDGYHTTSANNNFTLSDSMGGLVSGWVYCTNLASAYKIVTAKGSTTGSFYINRTDTVAATGMIEFKAVNYEEEGLDEPEATPTPTPTAVPAATPFLGIDLTGIGTFYSNIGTLISMVVGVILAFLGIAILLKASQAWIVGLILLVAGFFLQVMTIPSVVVLLIFAIEVILFSVGLMSIHGKRGK